MHILYFLSSAYLLLSFFVFLYLGIAGMRRLLSAAMFRKPGISMILFAFGLSIAFLTFFNPFPPSVNFMGDILVSISSLFLSAFYFKLCLRIVRLGGGKPAADCDVSGFAEKNGVEISILLAALSLAHIARPDLAFF